MGLGMIMQLTVFIVLSVILFAVSRQFADRVSSEQPPGIGANRFIGMEGVVLQRIDNLKNTGRVRMSREEWRAESEDTPAGSPSALVGPEASRSDASVPFSPL